MRSFYVGTNRDFLRNGLGINDQGILDQAVEWISVNLDPADVFDKDVLAEWAEAHGFKQQVEE